MTKSRSVATALCGILALAWTVLTHAQQPASLAAQAEGGRGLFFVELASPPAIDGTSVTTLEAEQSAFRAAATRRGLAIEERLAFHSLWNGLSLRIDPREASRLAALPGVRAVYPVELVQADPRRSTDGAELYTALAMTGADIAHQSGYTGAGVTVAVIDSGTDYHHPDLGGCFGAGCRVRQGYDFVGDAYQPTPSSPGYSPLPVPDLDPDDCNGHGTHVSGIVGARAAGPEGITGVAPDVTIHAYRVFGCGQPVGASVSTETDILLAALEAVGRDRPHVLNMSIGAAFHWPQYPTGQAADRLARHGVAVVASIGNSGGAGAYAASAPGVAAEVIGVASFDNTHVRLRAFRVSPDNRPIGYSPSSGAPLPPTEGTLPLRRTGTVTSTTDACSSTVPPTPPAAGSLTGAAALIRRGGCSFYEKAINAQTAGAAAVVIYNNAAGQLNPSVLAPSDPPGLPAVTIPVVGISDVNGALIDARIQAAAADAVTLTWTSEMTSVPNIPNGGLISAFSSYGPAPDLSIKPDIGAPGGGIRSTYPLDHPDAVDGYATLSGTSMSSPHAAGAVALLLEAKPSTSVVEIRHRLLNSADPKVWSLNPGTGLLDHVHRQGAGLVDIPGAISAATLIAPGKLSLGEVEGVSATRTITIANSGPAEVTYSLSHAPAVATRGTHPGTPAPPNPLQFLNAPASVTYSTNPISIAAGGTAEVHVTITPVAAAPAHTLFNGYVVATPVGGGDVLRVPYLGFKGDYQTIPILTPTAFGLPWLAKLSTAGTLTNQPAGATYTMTGTDIPFLVVHLDHQSYRVRMTVQHAATGRTVGRAAYEPYVPRNSGPTSFFLYQWDGSIETGLGWLFVPDGQYRLVFSVLKPLGDNLNPAHYETWTSPLITVARPPTPTTP